MSGESGARELRATGLQGVSLGETEIALVDGENGRLDLPRPRRRAARAREHVRGDVVPALERPPAGRRRARRPARAVPSRAWSCPPRCTMRSARSAPTRSRWTSCARASRSGARMRGRAEGGDSEDALWALAGDARDRRRLRAPARGRGAARARSASSGSSRTTSTSSAASAPSRRRPARSTPTSSSRAEHGMNASTFTARVIVSTLSRPGVRPRRRGRRAQGPAARRRAEPRRAT